MSNPGLEALREHGVHRMPLGEFLKTIEGKTAIRMGAVFCINSELWQGFRGGPAFVNPSQLAPHEIDQIIDVDGSFENVRKRLVDADEGREIAKRDELDERRAKKAQRDYHLLQLDTLRGQTPAASDVMALQAQVAALTRLVQQLMPAGAAVGPETDTSEPAAPAAPVDLPADLTFAEPRARVRRSVSKEIPNVEQVAAFGCTCGEMFGTPMELMQHKQGSGHA